MSVIMTSTGLKAGDSLCSEVASVDCEEAVTSDPDLEMLARLADEDYFPVCKPCAQYLDLLT